MVWFTAFTSFLLTSPPLFFHSLLAHMRCLLTHPFPPLPVSFPLSPSVLLSLASFIHPCHVVFSFFLFCFASNTVASCSLHSSFYPICDTLILALPLMIHPFTHLFWFFFPLLAPAVPHSLPLPHILFSLSPPIFLYTPLPPPIYFSTSLSLSFFPFTLSDGSIDSLCDDIAQGQPQGTKPL